MERREYYVHAFIYKLCKRFHRLFPKCGKYVKSPTFFLESLDKWKVEVYNNVTLIFIYSWRDKIMKKLLCTLLLALTCVVFAACVPSNIEKAKAKMEDAGYKVETLSKDDVEDEDAAGVVGALSAHKVDSDSILGGAVETITGDSDWIMATLFDSKDSAKKYYDKYAKEEEAEEDQIIKLDGKWIYMGTEAAVEAFTK